MSMTQVNSRGDFNATGGQFKFNSTKARRTSISVPSGVPPPTGGTPATSIPLDTLEWDFGDHYDSTNGRFVLANIGLSGLVRITIFAEFAFNANGFRGLYLVLDGSDNDVISLSCCKLTKPTRMTSIVTINDRAIGSTIALKAWQDSGSSLNVSAWMTMVILP